MGTPPRGRVGDTRRVATPVTAVAVERSGPAIRAALAAHAPEDCACFEAELRTALAHASDDLDLSGVETVLARWHALATMAANPLTAAERTQVEQAKAGDFTGLYTRDERGNWTQL
jgi:Family of unknown function (DUF6247)